jgi:flagellar protein FlaG
MDKDAIGSIATSNYKVADTRAPGPAAASVAANPTKVQTENAVKQAVATPTLDQVEEAVDSINQSMQLQSHGLVFSVDSDNKRTIVKVVDQQTSEVIRQIPSEETLAIAKSLDRVIGKLIQEKA